MANYRLLDYDNGNAELDDDVVYAYELRGGDRIIHSGTSFRVRGIEHDPEDLTPHTNLVLTRSNSN